MYNLSTPKFKFGLYVVDASLLGTSSGEPLVCHADSYEIKEDGSIIFYQVANRPGDMEKRFKVPVLAYPHGRWHACVLLDEENEAPVFNVQHASISPQQSMRQQMMSHASAPVQEVASTQDDGSDLDDLLGSNPSSTKASSPASNNAQDAKKQKEEWLEEEVKKFIREIELFEVEEFMNYLSRQPKARTYRVTESDVLWTASQMIRNKVVIARKFAEPNLQKILALDLPDIMKRQWDGNMYTILEVLQEREQTKNTTMIDLAVWMAQNKYS